MSFSAEADVPAPAETAYAILADYRNGHPRILPQDYFRDLVVDEGGFGAGTSIHFQARMMGVTRTLRAQITEPLPGRVLVEFYPDSGVRTTFTVDGRDGGSASHVTILTEFPARGLRGRLEALLARGLLKKVYALELANLAREAKARERE